MPGTKGGAAKREQNQKARIAAEVRREEAEKIQEVKITKPKAKGRGKKLVGTIPEALEGKAKKASVIVGKKEIKNEMINEYRKELEAKKEKIERNIAILDHHQIY